MRDTPTSTNNGTYTEDFNITAPGDPGDYDVRFTAFQGTSSDNDDPDCVGDNAPDCRGAQGSYPRAEQDLPPVCGINVMLILDESGSIGTGCQAAPPSGGGDGVRRLALGNRLRSYRSSSSTAGRASQSLPLHHGRPGRIDGAFTRYINDVANNGNDQGGSRYGPGNYARCGVLTNWEAAFRLAKSMQRSRWQVRGPGGVPHRRRPDGAEHPATPRV